MSDVLSLQAGSLASKRFDSQIEALQGISLNGSRKMSEKQMRDVANQFEELIIRQLLKEMRKTVPKNGFIEQSHASEMYMEMVDDHMAKQLADGDMLGVDRMIYQELKDKQDHMADPENSKNKKDFIHLQQPGQEQSQDSFIPLAKDSDTFIQFHNKNRMMDLPPQTDPFRKIDRNRRITTDRIHNL